MNTLPTEYRQFKGVTAAELGYDTQFLDTHYYEWESQAGQRLGVYSAEPTAGADVSRPTIIMPASHDYRLEPLWMRRMDILAKRANAKVVGVEAPGTVGLLQASEQGEWTVYDDHAPLSGARQTPAQLAAALRGDFSRHVDTQLQAVAETVGLTPSERIALFGESMGAAFAIDALRISRERQLNISDVILYESVNTFSGRKPLRPLQLAKVLPATENDRRNQYFEENEVIGHPMVAFEMASPEQAALDAARKSIGQQGVVSAAYGLGLATGRFDVLRQGMVLYPDARVDLVRGADSLATQRGEYEALTDALTADGVEAAAFEVTDARGEQAIGHAHLVSLGRMALVADWLDGRLRRTT